MCACMIDRAPPLHSLSVVRGLNRSGHLVKTGVMKATQAPACIVPRRLTVTVNGQEPAKEGVGVKSFARSTRSVKQSSSLMSSVVPMPEALFQLVLVSCQVWMVLTMVKTLT